MPKFVVPPTIIRSPRRGDGASPAERKAAERERLAEAGGKQIAINLPADAAADLAHIQERDGVSVKDAVIQALRREAQRR